MKHFMRALLCLCLLLPLGAKAEGSFTDIFVFGDSLSDTGNAAAGRNFLAGFEINLCHPLDASPLPPPRRGCADLFFEETRVSNGPVAVEILAERLGFDGLKPSLFFLPLAFRPFVGTNYAVAGATAGGSSLGDLNAQIAGFLADLDNSDLPPDLPTALDALYVVVIGGNDVIDAVQALLDPSEDPRAIIDDAVDAIGDNINLLIGAGARKFLVANSPNIGSIPAIKIAAEEAGVPPALLRGFATFVTIQFNRQLAARLGQIRAERQQIGKRVEIKKFNLFRFFEIVRFLGKLFGVFENIEDRCFDSDAYRDNGRPVIFHRDCGFDKFDRFVFFDDLHPTGQVHRIVGKALSKAARKLIDD